MFRRDFYGRYYPGPVQVYAQDAFTGPSPPPGLKAMLTRRVQDPAACPVLAWAAHDMNPDQATTFAQGLARTLAAPPGAIRVWTFYDRRAQWLGFRRHPVAFLFLATRTSRR